MSNLAACQILDSPGSAGAARWPLLWPVLGACLALRCLAAVAPAAQAVPAATSSRQPLARDGLDTAGAYAELGLRQARRGRLDEAAATFKAALDIAPGNRSARYNYARVLLALGRSKEALAELQRLADASPGDSAVALSLIEARFASGASGRALEDARAFADAASDAGALAVLGRVLRRSSQPRLAEAVLGRALRLSADSPEAWLESSRLRQHLGDLDGAVAAGQRAARLAPDSLEAALGYAEALISAQLYERARSHLAGPGRAFDSHPEHAYTLGAALFGLHRYLEAAVAFEKAAAADPAWSTARFFLGTSWLAAGEPRRAVEAYRAAIAADPRNPLPLVYLARAYDDLGPEFATSAVSAARQALQIDPHNVECLTRVARQALAEGRLDEARTSLEAIARAHPDIVKPRILLARVYYRLGLSRAAEAERSAIRALNARQQRVDAARGAAARPIPLPGLGFGVAEVP